MAESSARRRFAELARADEASLNLAEAALLIAGEEYPGLDLQAYQDYLDQRAARIREATPPEAPAHEQIASLNQDVFEREGFRGNVEDYYDPRNSFLNDVIDRRKGIPITLSVIYLEIGWRLGLPLDGVGMPGHFLVKFDQANEPILIDPFAGGKILTTADCQERLNLIYGGSVRLQSGFLTAVSKRQILVRMLTNLKGIYLQRDDYERALAAVDRVLLLNPNDSTQFRDRGLVHYRRRQFSHAASDLQTYLHSSPEPPDAPAIRRALDEIWRQQARLN